MGISAEDIVAGVGGVDNIRDIEECITRLRIEVFDSSLIDEAHLRAAGAYGVVVQSDVVQVVIGPNVDVLDAEIQKLRDEEVDGTDAA